MSIIAALLLAVLVGPERPVAPPSFGPAYGTQYPHELVTDGTDFLNVWSGIDGVYAAIVQEDGTPRTAAPRALFRGYNVQAAWAGDAYVLVWQEGAKVWTARLSRDARVLSTPVAIAEDARAMAIATQAGKTFVVLARFNGTTGTVIGANGEVLRGSIDLSPAPRPAAKPYCVTVAATSQGFVVAMIETKWQGNPESVATVLRFTLDGTVTSTQVLTTIPRNVNSIDATANGDSVGVAFVGRRVTNNDSQFLYTFTVLPDTVTAHMPRTVDGDDPQVVATPDGFAAGLIQYRPNAPLTLATMAFGSDARTTTPLDTNTPATDLRMATNGRRVLSVWRDSRFSPPYEYSTSNMFGIAHDAAALIPQTGVVPVTSSAVAQGNQVLASAGSSALLVWIDRTKTVRGNVMARRLDANGVPLDPKPLSIATDVDAFQQPVAVFTGEVWIVAWNVRLNADGTQRSYLRRISADGALLDEMPVDLHNGGVNAAASNGTVTVLAFPKKLMHFSRDGQLTGSVDLPEPLWPVALGTNGTEFLLAWNEGSDWWQFPSTNLLDIRAIRLDATGKPLDVTPINIATSPSNERSPIIASDGTDFLVAYEQRTDSEFTIRAKRVLRTGVLADMTATQDGSLIGHGEQSYAIASREGGYTALFTRPPDPERVDVHAVTLDARGVPAEASAILATTGWYGGFAPYVAVVGNIATYTRTDANLGNIERIFVRAIGNEPGRRRIIRR